MSATDLTDELEVAIFTSGIVDTRPLREGGEVSVGRDEACDLHVEDASVSRRHAIIGRQDGVLTVRDLGSANGTFLRDGGAGGGVQGATLRLRPVRAAATVQVGSVLQFGAVLAVVRRVPERQSATIVLREPSMRALYDRASRAAGSLISVLLLGETGVGKEVLAREIHERSPRAGKQFMALNCAALAPTLVESELFGHEKGTFTGASQSKVGLLESANGGTVFLDEIGELPQDVQVKLLRVLEERAVLSVGGRVPRPIDVRIVSATHRDLEVLCKEGRFREDLFFRLAGMALTIPPLRERRAEIPELAQLFLARACESGKRASVPVLSASASAALLAHRWPGNVRELRNAMELAAVLCSDDEVRTEHLPDRVRAGASASASASDASAPAAPGGEGDAERARILAAVERCGGNQTMAAEALGISRRTLVSRLSEYGLTRPRRVKTLTLFHGARGPAQLRNCAGVAAQRGGPGGKEPGRHPAREA